MAEIYMAPQQYDHIILPKATLKRFADSKTKKIKYLDLSDPEKITIRERFPHSFHTEPNYYTPEYDAVTKKYEIKLREYYKRITVACEREGEPAIDAQKLKTDILDIVNIQYQRTVMADDDLLRKLLEKIKGDYKKTSLHYLRQGIYPPEFLKNKQKFDEACKDIYTARRYVQRIVLKQKNPNILKQYGNFVPHILIIPNTISSTFILSPQHFVPISDSVRIVLSPRTALALYPVPLSQNGGLIKHLTKDEVDILAPRTIESALSMVKSFRQVVGEECYLNYIKSKLETYRALICDLSDDIIQVKGAAITLSDDQSFLELAISIQLFRPNCHKVIIDLSTISSQYLQKCEFEDSVQMFERWEFNLVFVNDCALDCSNIKIKSAQDTEEAITMF